MSSWYSNACHLPSTGYTKENHVPSPIQHTAKGFSGSSALTRGPFEFDGLKLVVPDQFFNVL
jgi:hypothetical protein